MNRFGKALLVATSLTPIFAVCALNSGLRQSWVDCAVYAGLFVVLAGLFLFLFKVVRSKLPRQELKSTKVKSADKEVLAFLLSYLLPFFFKESTAFAGEVGSAVFVVVVIGLIVFHSSAFTFNPLLAALGYHFYEVECGGMTYLLITKQHLAAPDNTLVARHLCDYIFVDDYKP